MPTIHLVRHAQGVHNTSEAAWLQRDPELTDLGRSQCAALAATFPFQDAVTHVVASPFRRTLYTALLGFAPALRRTAGRVTALALVQEVSTLPCDVGSPVPRLRDEFGDAVDLAGVPDDWYVKARAGPYAPEMAKLEARAHKARLWLRDLVRPAGGGGGGGEDAHVVLVSHGGFLHFLTGDWEGVFPNKGESTRCPSEGYGERAAGIKGLITVPGTGWENTEYRSYEFADPSGEDETASLRETKESAERRRGNATELSATEQRELRAVEQGNLQKLFDAVEQNGTGVNFEDGAV